MTTRVNVGIGLLALIVCVRLFAGCNTILGIEELGADGQADGTDVDGGSSGGSPSDGSPSDGSPSDGSPSDGSPSDGSSSSGGPACTTNADCAAIGECATTCESGSCKVTDGTLAASQVVGDCRSRICDGNGNVVERDDDADVPNGDPCSVVRCQGGEAVTSPAPTDTPCGDDQTLTCDGAGSCAGCHSNEECGASTECTLIECSDNKCKTTFVPLNEGDPPNQVEGDCKKIVCDGNGKTKSVVDDSDKPAASGDCVEGVCTNGTPGQKNRPSETPCGTNGICDGAGVCKGCVTAADCSGTPCATPTCQAGGVCGVVKKTDGTSCGTAQVCTDGACSSGCYIGGQFRAANVVNPGNPCQICTPGTSTSSWSNRTGSCDDGNTCTDNDVCSNGVCGGSPKVCNPSQCKTASCDPGTGQCSSKNVTGGNCDDGNKCTDNDTCNDGVCHGSPRACAPMQCKTVSCDPADGQCLYANLAGYCNDGNECTQTDRCSNGDCVGSNPKVCSPQDCQTASCNPADGSCGYTPLPDGKACFEGSDRVCKNGVCWPGCYISEVFYEKDEENSMNRCLVCNPLESVTRWTDKNCQGQLCVDGNCQLN
jgi:hypothetical protein